MHGLGRSVKFKIVHYFYSFWTTTTIKNSCVRILLRFQFHTKKNLRMQFYLHLMRTTETGPTDAYRNFIFTWVCSGFKTVTLTLTTSMHKVYIVCTQRCAIRETRKQPNPTTTTTTRTQIEITKQMLIMIFIGEIAHAPLCPYIAITLKH